MSISDFILALGREHRDRQIREIMADNGISEAEAEAMLAERERKAAETEAAEAEARALQRRAEGAKKLAEERAFRRRLGEELGLGVPVHYGHIIVIGGLTERSWGDGMVSNTVYHLVFDAPFERGRLRRDTHDLLCRPRRTSRTNPEVTGCGQWHPDDVLDDFWHGVELTCKRCREMFDRLSRNAGT